MSYNNSGRYSSTSFPWDEKKNEKRSYEFSHLSETKQEEPPYKKRKVNDDNRIVSFIVEIQPENRKWLVEWRDKTRSWENYDDLKNLDSFRMYLESIITKPRWEPPFYIN